MTSYGIRGRLERLADDEKDVCPTVSVWDTALYSEQRTHHAKHMLEVGFTRTLCDHWGPIKGKKHIHHSGWGNDDLGGHLQELHPKFIGHDDIRTIQRKLHDIPSYSSTGASSCRLSNHAKAEPRERQCDISLWAQPFAVA